MNFPYVLALNFWLTAIACLGGCTKSAETDADGSDTELAQPLDSSNSAPSNCALLLQNSTVSLDFPSYCFPYWQNGDSLIFLTPNNLNLGQLPIRVQAKGLYRDIDHQALDDTPFQFDFSKPRVLTLTGGDSIAHSYVLRFIPSNLPLLRIATDSGAAIQSKDTYLRGSLNIDQASPLCSLRIRGRGNTSWLHPKKPYRLKLDKAEALLGMPSEKDWALLANYNDKTLLRNRIALKLANRMGMTYVPKTRFVDLAINNEYQGVYLLAETVESGKHRVDIDDDNFLLEVDARLDGEYTFQSLQGIPFVIKSPSEPTNVELQAIQKNIQHAEDVLFSELYTDPSQGYSHVLDIKAFVNWFILMEYFKENDAFFSSTFLYSTANHKIAMGPVWDFDLAAGNTIYNDNAASDGWWVRNNIWYRRLFSDSSFLKDVRQRWTELSPLLQDSVHTWIDEESNYLQIPQAANFSRWNILSSQIWPSPNAHGSYEGEVEYLNNWLHERYSWIQSNLYDTSLSTLD